jgi:hypothetical protein
LRCRTQRQRGNQRSASTPKQPDIATGGVQGFATFSNGIGTITLNGGSAQIQFTNGPGGGANNNSDNATVYSLAGPASLVTYQATMSVTVAPVAGAADEFTLTETSDTLTILVGPGSGQTVSVTGVPPMNGVASRNSPTVLTAATSMPAIEAWIYSGAGVGWPTSIPAYSFVCQRTRVFTKVVD